MRTSLLWRRILLTGLLILFQTWLVLSVYAQGVQDPKPSPANTPIQQSQGQTDEQVGPSPALRDRTADGLKWFFTVLVYPGVVGGIFLLLTISMVYIVRNGEGFGYVRRLTGALLPLLMLTFMLLMTDKGDDPVKSFFLNRNPFIYLFLGFIIGLALVEFGKRLIRTDDDRWGSIYNLFLSSMFVFLLYSIMKGFLDSLVYFLFSMIMAGGLDIIFSRPMESWKSKTAPAFLKSPPEKADRTWTPPSETYPAPRTSEAQPRTEEIMPEGRSPSAHRAAKPRRVESVNQPDRLIEPFD